MYKRIYKMCNIPKDFDPNFINQTKKYLFYDLYLNVFNTTFLISVLKKKHHTVSGKKYVPNIWTIFYY